MNPSSSSIHLEPIRSNQEDLTSPLDFFYAQAGLVLPDFRVLAGKDVPEPFRQLLVHQDDMTPTLEAYYGHELELQVLGRRRSGREYWREVVLLLRGNGQPVEFGANRVWLDRFPPAAQQAILDERAPLGHIMRDHRVKHCCQPNAFLQMQTDKLMEATLQLACPAKVYGRHNRLYDPDGQLLSEVVEILRPPPNLS